MKKRVVVALVIAIAGLAAAAQAKRPDKEVAGTLNVNQASESQLEQLPGVGPKVAKEIIEYRSQKSFEKPADLRHVKGVGRATYEKIKDHVAVDGRSNLTTVSPHAPAKATKPAKGRVIGTRTVYLSRAFTPLTSIGPKKELPLYLFVMTRLMVYTRSADVSSFP